MPTVAELKALGSCWTTQQLEAAAASWPSANPSWSWFLGERLAVMTREDALLRLQMASAYIYRAGTRLPRVRRLSDVVKYGKACNRAQLAELAAAMGALCDANGNSAEAAERVSNILAQRPLPEPEPQPPAEPPADEPPADSQPPAAPEEPTS